ncbi:MAG: hypothetical protein EOR16_31980 [Mesorhizobium sp.]|uniref:pyridoxal-dependent decarboxylase n=1 Tax=Mesorhizobium sp. TaxID=1871066 RepID=UPI000FEA99C4|nr:pyridoxal-dependent decarboxylase [Mesorhizobium sp.]RWI49126.1 MAG: hypothetical protein EOR16_31980 [Mesorhizobium sp.]
MPSSFNWPARSEEELTAILKRDVQLYEQDTRNFLGYPRNLLVDAFADNALAQLSKFHIHNVGDYEAGSQYPLQAFDKELLVVEFFKKLWNCDGREDDFWGYVTANGSEGNVWGASIGMRVLLARHNCDPVIICNREAHYSLDKSQAMSRLKLEVVDTNKDGSIKIEALENALEKHKEIPIILCLMNGTTVKEGRDNIPAALNAIKRTGRDRGDFYIHVDAAFSGVYLPLIDASPDITPGFNHDVDSISASGHKFIGTPTPCGVIVMERGHSDIAAQSVEYISSRDKTMGGSRDGHAIYQFWLLIERYGTKQLREWALAGIAAAETMANRLTTAGVPDVLLNPHALTVYFPAPSAELSKKYCLARQGKFAHAICTPHTLSKGFGGYDTANRFTEEYIKEILGSTSSD